MAAEKQEFGTWRASLIKIIDFSLGMIGTAVSRLAEVLPNRTGVEIY
jgi:hypothetical protein